MSVYVCAHAGELCVQPHHTLALSVSFFRSPLSSLPLSLFPLTIMSTRTYNLDEECTKNILFCAPCSAVRGW